MEATGLSLGKAVLDGALGYVNSAIAEKAALQLGIQRDQAFIRDELEMMLAFLMAAHVERDEHKVIKTWVKQVQDVAYDAEDCLMDFAVRLGKPTWWRIPCKLLERRRVAKQMKELKAKVEEVSQRNGRYGVIKGSGSKPAITVGQSSMASASMSGIEEAMRQQNKAKVDLIQLISEKDENLRVISVWGTSGDIRGTTIVKLAYDELKRNKKFGCHALIKVQHPFNRTWFLQNIVRQFYVESLEEAAKTQQKSTPGAQDLRRMGLMNEGDHLVDAFKKFVREKSYLMVLSDVSTIEDWNQIKACFPSNRKGSRIIVCAEQVEVASLCVGPETVLPEHKQLFSNLALYAFYEKGSQRGTDSTQESSSSNANRDTIDTNDSTEGKGLDYMETTVAIFKDARLIGRDNEKSKIIGMISSEDSQEFEVISVCGMGGLGKTTLVEYLYQSQEVNAMFDKCACITIKRPFNHNEVLSSLATQLGGGRVYGISEGKRYLIVLDDISSTTEWDAIVQSFPTTVARSRIVVTTRDRNIAKHCSKKDRNI